MRALAPLIISTGVILALAVPALRDRTAADHRRIHLGAAARPETRGRLPQGISPPPAPKVKRRPVRHRHQRRRRRPLRHRRLLPRPDQRRRPARARSSRRSPATALCIITNPNNPIANLSQKASSSIFTGRDRDWSQVPGAQDHRPDRPVRPRRRLRYAGRLPAHLPRRNAADLRERDAPRPRTASSS